MQDAFSRTVTEARSKFIEAARDVGASVRSFLSMQTGPDGEPLYLDVARCGRDDVPARAERLLSDEMKIELSYAEPRYAR